MTAYAAIYDDSEVDPSLPATKLVVGIHRSLGIPATFGIVTQPLENDPELARAYRSLLSNPADRGLFTVIPHSHTHAMLLDHRTLGKGVDPDRWAHELGHSKELVESIFEQSVVGFRSPNGFHRGWQGHPDLLKVLVESGFTFLSSDLMGPGDTVPAPLTQPYYYAADGFTDLLEIPGHDWHDNVLSGWPGVPAAWPPCVPGGLPNRPPQNPKEKFDVYRPSIDWCVENDLSFYSPALHPWSILRFDPTGRWIEMLLNYAVMRGMKMMPLPEFANHWRTQPPGSGPKIPCPV